MSSTPTLRGRTIAQTAVVAVALTACSGADKDGGGSGIDVVAGTGGVAMVARKDRVAAPDISGRTIAGERLSLATYRDGDKVIVLNTWGSWCSPCRAEARGLIEVAKETKAEGVRFVGINTRDYSVENARAFEKNFSVPYPSLYDPHGALLSKFPRGSLNPQGIPNTLILDRDGKIAVRILKPIGSQELRQVLDPLIAEE